MNDKSTLENTQQFNEKIKNNSNISINVTNLSIIKDDIKNYRSLTDLQLKQIENLSESEKIEIIKVFNIVIKSIEYLI